MLLLFNETIKPLNQIKKKKIQKKSVFGANADNFLPFLKIFFPQFFFLLHASSYEP